MKKKFFLVAVAAAALASCSQNETLEVSNRNAINFRVTSEYATRAVEYNSKYLMPEINVTAVKPNGEELFSNKTWENKNGSWSTTDPVFWPNETEELSFYGFYPTDLKTSLTTSLKVENFTPKMYAKDQVDVMAAFNQCSQEEQGSVHLHFKHLLSQIAVQAKNMNESYTVKVRGVKLSGFKTSANIDLPNSKTDASTAVNNSWSGMSGSGYYIAKRNMVELGETAQPITGTNDDEDKVSTFMVLPQKLEAWDGTTYENATGAYIAVLCQITRNTDNVIIYPKQNAGENMYAYTAIPVDTELEMGKKYTYTLVFFDGENGGAGLVDPKPEEGTDVNGDGTNDNVDDDPSIDDGTDDTNKEGEIISTKAITVQVSCDDWEEGETVEKDMGTTSSTTTQLESVDLGLSVKWAAKAYGVTSENPYGVYMKYDEIPSLEGYRLPTREEAEELLACQWEQVVENGVTGYRINGKTDASIFLPCAGYAASINEGSYNVNELGGYFGYWISEKDMCVASRDLFSSGGRQIWKIDSQNGVGLPIYLVKR